MPKAWAPPAGMAALETLTLFNNADLTGCLPPALAGPGPAGAGYFQASSGQLTKDVKSAAAGTKISGVCTARRLAAP